MMNSKQPERESIDAASIQTPVELPTIDFAALNRSPEERAAVLNQLDENLRTYGMAYLSNHSVSQELVDEAFDWSRRLFALPLEVKLKAKHPPTANLDSHRGYAAEGIGHVTQLIFDRDEIDKTRDIFRERKETFELGNPFPESGAAPNLLIPEEDFPNFREFHERWWSECIKLQHAMLRFLGEILQVEDKDILSKNEDRNDAHLSLMYYPRVPIGPLKSRQHGRLNAHTDYGSLTLLFQDHVGGLEMHNGKFFQPVAPKRGTVILNIGDILERQTNGRWKSVLHQVVAPREVEIKNGSDPDFTIDDRVGIAYLGHPNPDVIIDTLPGCEEEGKWRPNINDGWDDKLTCFEWLNRRTSAEYSAKAAPNVAASNATTRTVSVNA